MASIRGTALTLGTYDGVHRGHRKVFRTLERLAAESGLKTLVLAFEEPPKNFFRPDAPVSLLTLPEERKSLLLAAGLDRVELVRFDASIAALPARRFFDGFLRARWRARAICEGEDFGFGKDRGGNIALLEELCDRHGVALQVLPLAKADSHQKISSSFIRQLLYAGEIERANELLGYPYFIRGEVIRGQGLGARLGLPTANLAVDRRKVLPQGVFAVRVRIPGEVRARRGACNIGTRPTVAGAASALHVEAHIPGFTGSLYGVTLQLELSRRIRPEKKFPSLLALKRQIKKDISAALEG